MEEKPPFLQAVSDIRGAIEQSVGIVRTLKEYPSLMLIASDGAEVMANIMIAVRHLEDAKMRLGKVVQHYQGGRSVYDEGAK